MVFPNAVNTALFEQERKRTSGTIGLQLKPSDSFELNLTGVYVKAEYDNYNQSRYAFVGHSLSAPNATSATVTNGVVSSADFSNGLTLLDAISRQSEVETYAVDLRADWAGDGWNSSAIVGTTEAMALSNNISSSTKRREYSRRSAGDESAVRDAQRRRVGEGR